MSNTYLFISKNSSIVLSIGLTFVPVLELHSRWLRARWKNHSSNQYLLVICKEIDSACDVQSKGRNKCRHYTSHVYLSWYNRSRHQRPSHLFTKQLPLVMGQREPSETPGACCELVKTEEKSMYASVRQLLQQQAVTVYRCCHHTRHSLPQVALQHLPAVYFLVGNILSVQKT